MAYWSRLCATEDKLPTSIEIYSKNRVTVVLNWCWKKIKKIDLYLFILNILSYRTYSSPLNTKRPVIYPNFQEYLLEKLIYLQFRIFETLFFQVLDDIYRGIEKNDFGSVIHDKKICTMGRSTNSKCDYSYADSWSEQPKLLSSYSLVFR